MTSNEPIKAEYIADHALMVDIQSNAYVGGAALPASLLSAVGGMTVGVWWLSVLLYLGTLALLGLAFYATNRSLEARALAGAHATAAAITKALAD